MNSALVTGASGVLGSQLVTYLTHHGWRVSTLARGNFVAPSDGIVNVAGDLLDSGAVRCASKGADVVFHLAASRTNTGRGDTMSRINIEGTRTVAREARAAGVKRFVYFGSTAVYGDTTGTVASELSTPAPVSEYARTKLAGEMAALEEGPSTIVLRLATVYGPHISGNYLRLARLCRRGIQLVGRNRRTLIYEDDVMTAALLAAGDAGPQERIYNVTDGAVHTLTDITKVMVQAMGQQQPQGFRVPVAPLSSVGQWIPGIGHDVRKLVEDSAVESKRAQSQLDFHPAWTLEDGWRATIASWQSQGVL